jgi:hypothetical protein
MNHVPQDEEMPPEIGGIVTVADPHPVDSGQSYDYAESVAAGWLADRGLQIVGKIPGVKAQGLIVSTRYDVMKSPAAQGTPLEGRPPDAPPNEEQV